jgi:hypothetical protein
MASEGRAGDHLQHLQHHLTQKEDQMQEEEEMQEEEHPLIIR